MLGSLFLLIGTWVTARFSRKTGEEANEAAATQARTADWEAFSREWREWTEDRFAERDQKINALTTEVAEIRSELDSFMSKYRIAIAYIRRVVHQLQRHVEPDEIEAPPPEISADL
ncbi:hypothetical protein [Dietzia sp. ANT_WB102]|uniref:hypothetical protein n=1 Tax=Dietzia sp. ANT_WB102 TaxID=2597345 RepID=UPI0011EBC96A|nr:hypothetical protein [Dietzia sp. ANT_WB102]